MGAAFNLWSPTFFREKKGCLTVFFSQETHHRRRDDRKSPSNCRERKAVHSSMPWFMSCLTRQNSHTKESSSSSRHTLVTVLFFFLFSERSPSIISCIPPQRFIKSLYLTLLPFSLCDLWPMINISSSWESIKMCRVWLFSPNRKRMRDVTGNGWCYEFSSEILE